MKTTQLKKGFKIPLPNNNNITFQYMGDFDNPIFYWNDNSRQKIAIVDNNLYSATSDDEPDCPLKKEYQEYFNLNYSYDFFKATITIKKG